MSGWRLRDRERRLTDHALHARPQVGPDQIDGIVAAQTPTCGREEDIPARPVVALVPSHPAGGSGGRLAAIKHAVPPEESTGMTGALQRGRGRRSPWSSHHRVLN
jgi:hypothetical protein